jgi:hypothetical protein
MIVFYNTWKTEWREKYKDHIQKHAVIRWLEVFGTAEGNAAMIRYHKSKDWLEYLDTLQEESKEIFLQVCEEFATVNKYTHSVFVRKIYYSSVRSWINTNREDGNKLKQFLLQKGFAIQDVVRRQT